MREQLLRAGVDREVDAVARRHVGDLLGRALVQVQLDVRIALAELADHRRQHIARLRVRRADGQRAAAVALLLVGQALDALDFLEDLLGPLDDPLAGRGDPRQGAALAQEDRKAELVLELFELLADAGLRGMQPFRRRGDVEVVLDDRGEVA